MSWRDLDQSDLQKLPKLDEREINHLWHIDYWDGPLTGVAEYRGEQCWFQFAGDINDGRNYSYVLYPLTGEQRAQLQGWHDRREKWWAEYAPWKDEEGRQVAIKAWNEAGLEWTGPDLTGVTPLGWFMDGANQEFYGVQLEKHDGRQEATEGVEADHQAAGQ